MKLRLSRDKNNLVTMTRAEVPMFAIFGYPNKTNQLINLGIFDKTATGAENKGLSIHLENGGLYIGSELQTVANILGQATPTVHLDETEEGKTELVESMTPSMVYADGSTDTTTGKPKLFALLGYSEEVYRSHIAMDLNTLAIIPVGKKHQGKVVGTMTWHGKVA